VDESGSWQHNIWSPNPHDLSILPGPLQQQLLL
jgi:hypothetical protein